MCDGCGKAFGFKDGLDRHRLVHPPYGCPICARLFPTADALRVRGEREPRARGTGEKSEREGADMECHSRSLWEGQDG